MCFASPDLNCCKLRCIISIAWKHLENVSFIHVLWRTVEEEVKGNVKKVEINTLFSSVCKQYMNT